MSIRYETYNGIHIAGEYQRGISYQLEKSVLFFFNTFRRKGRLYSSIRYPSRSMLFRAIIDKFSSSILVSSNFTDILPLTTSIESTPSILPMNRLSAREHSAQTVVLILKRATFMSIFPRNGSRQMAYQNNLTSSPSPIGLNKTIQDYVVGNKHYSIFYLASTLNVTVDAGLSPRVTFTSTRQPPSIAILATNE